MIEPKKFRSGVRPNWCPGCGDFSVLNALTRSFSDLDLAPHQITTVSGIGCSGRISGYLNTYGFHGVHGRALPVAQGVKLANRDLTVMAIGGDGDGLGIGLNHLIHAIRRNVDITYIIIDNHIYGLTKGQTSPTSSPGFVSKTTPKGSLENTIAPLQLALSAGIGFLAQGFTGNPKQLMNLIKAGIRHNGFSLIVVLSNCVTYNKQHTLQWFKENITNLDEDNGYSPDNRQQALIAVSKHEELATGLIYQEEKQSYQDLLPGHPDTVLVKQDLTPEQELLNQLMQAFY